MPYHEGDELIAGYEIVRLIPGGPLSERYVVKDAQGVYYEVELLPSTMETPQVARIAYRSLLFVANLKHPCLPESHGTIAIPTPDEDHSTSFREVPLWEHAAGRLTLDQLVESIGPLHPAQAAEIILSVSTALLSVDRASRNSTGESFPHLALTPVNIALRENRIPVLLGWANRAAFLADIKPTFHQSRFASFLDSARGGRIDGDRRRDVYALASCLFYLVKGFPPPFRLQPPTEENENAALAETMAPSIGEKMSALLGAALSKRTWERPSVETFVRELAAARSEIEAAELGSWQACAACGLMMKNDADLCPLCIRERIVPVQDVPPPALNASPIPQAVSLSPYGEVTGLEELTRVLPRMVRDAAMSGRTHEFERIIQRILLHFAGEGLREFVGDLIEEDGTLTDDPYWVTTELAHRINPEAADSVALNREKGAFLRWLTGREGRPWFRKSLRTDVTIEGVRVDVVFRGRFYLFRTALTPSVCHQAAKLSKRTRFPIVLVTLRASALSLPADLTERVSLYVKSPPTRSVPKRALGWLDEYRFFSFVRGPSTSRSEVRQ